MNNLIELLKEEWKVKSTKHKFLALVGGVDVTMSIFFPILIASIWINVFGLGDWSSYFIFALCLISSMFRAYKVGWMK